MTEREYIQQAEQLEQEVFELADRAYQEHGLTLARYITHTILKVVIDEDFCENCYETTLHKGWTCLKCGV